MLITKTVIIKWKSKTKEYYESKGYIFTKIGDKFQINIKDLINGSNILVEVKCDCEDCKNPYLKLMKWYDYLKCIKDDEKYYCHDCSMKLFGTEKYMKTKLKKGKSFEQWCIDNNRQDVLDRWDYEINNYKPSKILYGTKNKYYFKCSKGLHKSELKSINAFTNGQEGSIKCNQCNSFAQWGIDGFGEDFLDKYWDYEKNNELKINPWEISYGNKSLKVWIKCQEKDYHGSYGVSCNSFINKNSRCPYCTNRNGKVHSLDSLGTLYPKVSDIWSDKNEKSPYKYSPNSGQYVWWKCPDEKHKDYFREINNSNICDFRCPECQFSKGEGKINNCLIDYSFIKISQEEYDKLSNKNNNKYYIPQKTFDGLVGINNGLLSYDFYLPKYNLIIEYQGEFHDGNGNYYMKQNLKKQVEHDKRKREYAIRHNINLLEIWYSDYENIEEILNRELN